MLKRLLLPVAAGVLTMVVAHLLRLDDRLAFGGSMAVAGGYSAWLIPGRAVGKSRLAWALVNSALLGTLAYSYLYYR